MHLQNPRDVGPESNRPAYPGLEQNKVKGDTLGAHMNGLRIVGVPYTDADIAGAKQAVEGKTEEDAMIAYLQVLGTALKGAK